MGLLKKQTPGPGAYDPWALTSKLEGAPMYSMGTGTRDTKTRTAKLQPGPGQYELDLKPRKGISIGQKSDINGFLGFTEKNALK
jgi:hypothetical protein